MARVCYLPDRLCQALGARNRKHREQHALQDSNGLVGKVGNHRLTRNQPPLATSVSPHRPHANWG